jgi:predicted HicB family RNase H-like nuclease
LDNLLEYKGYHGKVEYSVSDKCLYGSILGINALVTFEGNDSISITKAFQESVDDYLDFCAQQGLKPEKEYKGQFNVRVSPDLHKKAALLADKKETTLNAIVVSALDLYIEKADGKASPINFTVNLYPNQIMKKDFLLGSTVKVLQDGGKAWQRQRIS